jgi:catechol 2,3-dioxygenase-like lactoylglutathione lyase family enzyme
VVSRIGHVGLRVTHLDRSVAFAEQVLGLREVERDGSTSYLTCNNRHHELVLIEGDRAGCDHLAFEAFDAAELERLRETLERRRVAVLADEPLEHGIADAVRFIAPGGFVFEVFHGMAKDEVAHYPTAGVRPRKFEHITVKSSRKRELEGFLVDVLGLRISDRAEDAITWLRVSEEHHGVSVIDAGVDQLQHYAWQTDGWDAFRRVGDRLMAEGLTFLWGPGHHGIGDNYFCYFEDRDGVIVEYSGDIQRIEDEATYQPRVWPDEPLSVNRWGNPPPPVEFQEGGVPLVHPSNLATPR